MATVRWLGAAADVRQVDTTTFALTWAQGDTVDFAINKKHLIYTVGTAVTTADVVAGCRRMFLANSPTAGRINDESWNFGGKQIAEFTEIDSNTDAIEDSGSDLILRWTAGIPVTITVTATTAGDGTATLAATTAATGKHFFNNADNWSGASNPSATDTILFDQGSVDVKYAINNTTADLNLIRKNSYTGNIGLPAINQLGYPEYRQRYLDLPITATTGSQEHIIGETESPVAASGRTYVNFGTNTAGLALILHDTASSDQFGCAVQVAGGRDLDLIVHAGSVSVGSDLVATAAEITWLIVRGGYVHIGANCTFDASATATEQTGGTMDIDGATGAPDFNCRGGVSRFNANVSFGALACFGGSNVIRRSGTFSTITVYPDGIFDNSQSAVFTTCSGVTLYKGATFKDPHHHITYSNGIDFVGCQPSDVLWDAKDHLTWTPSTI